MKLPFSEEAYDVGLGTCTLHGRVTIYAIFLGMNFHTNIVRVGFVCEECHKLYGEHTAVTEQDFTLKEFAQRLYFEDSTRDN